TEIGASDYVSDLESSLERAISQMRGIGSVSVVVTLETDRQTIYATSSSNDTERIEEHDSSGGVRTTQRSTTTTEPIVVRKSGGNEELVMVGVEPPKVRGVLVVAEGASTPEVRLEIAQAVSSALGVALHRVAVVEKEV
ncbi:MAG: stage III sporulation protein AG, partial [Bacillota bacterium]